MLRHFSIEYIFYLYLLHRYVCHCYVNVEIKIMSILKNRKQKVSSNITWLCEDNETNIEQFSLPNNYKLIKFLGKVFSIILIITTIIIIIIMLSRVHMVMLLKLLSKIKIITTIIVKFLQLKNVKMYFPLDQLLKDY